MTRTSRFVVAAALLCLGFGQQAAADPIRITAGSVLLTGPSELGTIFVSGTGGFTLQPLVDPLEGNTVMAQCGISPCLPGETNIGGMLAGSAFPNGVATFEGTVYDDIDNLNSPAAVALAFAGSAMLPAVPDAPISTIITAFFALTPGSAFFLPSGPVAITGGGTATLWLSPSVDTGGPPGWVLDQIRYNFSDTEPVPEPGTMLLFGTGALAAWRFRRRPGSGADSRGFTHESRIGAGSRGFTHESRIGAGSRGFTHGSRIGAVLADPLLRSRVADRRGLSRIFCFTHGSRIDADSRGSFMSQRASVPDPRISSTRARASRGAWTPAQRPASTSAAASATIRDS